MHQANLSSQENSVSEDACRVLRNTQFKRTGGTYMACRMDRQEQNQNCQLNMLTFRNRSSFSKISAIASKVLILHHYPIFPSFALDKLWFFERKDNNEIWTVKEEVATIFITRGLNLFFKYLKGSKFHYHHP